MHLREPGQSHKETIATGTAAAAAGGFTAVCAMPNTSPVNDSPEITRWMQAPERQALVRLFPIAAATVGSLGEKLTDFAALKKAGAVAVSDDGKPILDDTLMREALRAAAKLKLPVVQHAEDSRHTAGCSMNHGPTSFRLGLRGMPNTAESDIVRRDIALARETRSHIHVAHISTAEAMDAVRQAKKAGIRATAEVTPHHFTLIDENVGEFDTNYKMNPPLRSRADRDAMIAGIVDGTIDAIATDHAPHAFHEKQVEFERAAFGIIGLETALPIALTVLHHHFKLPLWRIVELLSSNSRARLRSRRIGYALARSPRRRHDLRSREEVDVRRLAVQIQVAQHALRRLELHRPRRRNHRRRQGCLPRVTYPNGVTNAVSADEFGHPTHLNSLVSNTLLRVWP